jgi:hypothetical protein
VSFVPAQSNRPAKEKEYAVKLSVDTKLNNKRSNKKENLL